MPTSPANDEPPEDDAEVEVEALRAELERSRDRHRRALADLDNYRKRVERDSDRRATEARLAMLREWLEAVDSVERALRIEPDDPGLTAVLAQMEAILARHGVVRMDALGSRFDPERHEAIAVVPTTDAPDHTVVEVARSGFGLGDGGADEVLRPAQVVVGRRPTGDG